MTAGALAAKIDALLPQTQCAKCGYAGCMPYAEAIAAGAADINRCPPGGEAGVHKLALLLGREPKPLNPAHGVERPRAVARIAEAHCIGCTLCIQACPVDAIVGAAKCMHTVIEPYCTGCDLCLPACPVNCIEMLPLPPARSAWTEALAHAARERFQFRRQRLAREEARRAERIARKAKEGDTLAQAKKAVILAAIERAKARVAGIAPGNTTNPLAQIDAETGAVDAHHASAKKR